MQIKSLRIRSYRSFKVNDTTPAHALERLRRIETYRALRAEGCAEPTALRAVGWSRSTCFRWLKRYNTQGVRGLANRSRRPRHTQRPRWTRGDERRVWAMRTRFPFMGKRRLRVMLARDGRHLKEFKAVSPVGKQLVARAYSRATAHNAKRFLAAVQADLPHPLVSIQVDGGSEFMADFEQACQDLNIPLYVLPPRRPQFNGCVERANDSTRVEFWNLYQGHFTVADANQALADYQHFHNQVRPHQTLDWKTPNAYLQQSKDCPTQSHM